MVEQLEKDMIEAMKNKEKERLAVIRAVKAGLKQEQIDHKKEINDELLIDVVNRQVKMRKESIVEFEKANRNDLIEQTTKEIEILNEYMPEQMSEEELNKIIDEVFASVNPTSSSDMGKIMREITPLVKGKADMSLVSKLIKDELNK